MSKYEGKQRKQLSKVIGDSESKDVQLKRFIDNRPQAISQMNFIRSIQKKPNNTGLPDNLKSGVENLSGYSMDDVKVHYNSRKPAQLNALAYTQGTDIHVAPGQKKHLPHEAWHVVRQKQDWVQPTMQLQGVSVNDNAGLEREADVMGGKADLSTQQGLSKVTKQLSTNINLTQLNAIQCRFDKDWEYIANKIGEKYSFYFDLETMRMILSDIYSVWVKKNEDTSIEYSSDEFLRDIDDWMSEYIDSEDDYEDSDMEIEDSDMEIEEELDEESDEESNMDLYNCFRKIVSSAVYPLSGMEKEAYSRNSYERKLLAYRFKAYAKPFSIHQRHIQESIPYGRKGTMGIEFDGVKKNKI